MLYVLTFIFNLLFYIKGYFNKIEKEMNNDADTESFGAFYYSSSKTNYLYINNSKFENINIISSAPLIYSNGLILE